MRQLKWFYCVILAGVLVFSACGKTPAEEPTEQNTDIEQTTEQNAGTEDIGSYSKRAAEYFAGRYVDEDGTLVLCIKNGGEEFEELLTKVYGSGYKNVRISYVKYSELDIIAQYAHLKERIQNAEEEISGIVRSYGVGSNGIAIGVNENNEEKMAKIRALADDPEVVTVMYVPGEPVNH